MHLNVLSPINYRARILLRYVCTLTPFQVIASKFVFPGDIRTPVSVNVYSLTGQSLTMMNVTVI